MLGRPVVDPPSEADEKCSSEDSAGVCQSRELCRRPPECDIPETSCAPGSSVTIRGGFKSDMAQVGIDRNGARTDTDEYGWLAGQVNVFASSAKLAP